MKCHINLSINPDAAKLADELRKKHSVNLSQEFEKMVKAIAKKIKLASN